MIPPWIQDEGTQASQADFLSAFLTSKSPPAPFGGLVAQSRLTPAIPWTVAHQAPLSTGFPRQEYWSGLPFPSPEDLPNPGLEPGSSALQADSLPCPLPSSIIMYIQHDWTELNIIMLKQCTPCNVYGVDLHQPMKALSPILSLFRTLSSFRHGSNRTPPMKNGPLFSLGLFHTSEVCKIHYQNWRSQQWKHFYP